MITIALTTYGPVCRAKDPARPSGSTMVSWSDLSMDAQDEEHRERKRRREQGVLVAAEYLLSHGIEASRDPRGRGPQGKKRRDKTPFIWEEHVLRLTELEFKQRYRLDYDSFRALLQILRSDLEVVDAKQAMNGNWGQIVDVRVKLAIALRFCAGGTPLDLRLIYRVSHDYVYKCVWLVVDAINKHMPAGFPIDDVEKLTVLESDFRAKSMGGFWEGQVGALDGVHFGMLAPSNDTVQNARKYHVARKDMFALLCMAISDAHRRILWWDISHTPTTHDSQAWECTELGWKIAQGQLPAPFFLSGDSAFSLSNSMITPSDEPSHDDFNYHQSSNRMPIECAFGLLIRRWGVLWRPLAVKFERRACLISALIRLHNFCIDRKLSADHISIDESTSEIQPGRWDKTPRFDKMGRPVDFLTNSTSARLARDRRKDKTDRRDALVQLVADEGLKRPPLQTGQFKKKRGRGGGRGKQ